MDHATDCSVHPPVTVTRKEISVNGVVIDRRAIAREAQNHQASKPVLAWQAAARALVIRQLLIGEAQRLSIEAEPLRDDRGRRETEEEAQIRALIEREVQLPRISGENCRIYYDNNRARFRAKTIWVLDQIRQEPSLFEPLAREMSDCPSASEGGSLGQVLSGETTPLFEAALDALNVGEITAAPIATPYGFHIIRLDRRVEGEVLPFEQVKDRIASYLTDNVRRRAEAQYIKILAGQARIEGIAFEAAPGMMVQ
jgi:peptidyl-prolyl cis-trans isomerase C